MDDEIWLKCYEWLMVMGDKWWGIINEWWLIDNDGWWNMLYDWWDGECVMSYNLRVMSDWW